MMGLVNFIAKKKRTGGTRGSFFTFFTRPELKNFHISHNIAKGPPCLPRGRLVNGGGGGILSSSQIGCMGGKPDTHTRGHTHTRTHTRTYILTHTHTPAHTHILTHTDTHTDTHTHNNNNTQHTTHKTHLFTLYKFGCVSIRCNHPCSFTVKEQKSTQGRNEGTQPG